jgi:hypothetical protein
MRIIVILAAFPLASCDQISQRIWNCSASAVPVTKLLSTGTRVDDVIPPYNYIASMKGGVQIAALEKLGTRKREVIWRQKQARRVKSATENPCELAISGLIGQQF